MICGEDVEDVVWGLVKRSGLVEEPEGECEWS